MTDTSAVHPVSIGANDTSSQASASQASLIPARFKEAVGQYAQPPEAVAQHQSQLESTTALSAGEGVVSSELSGVEQVQTIIGLEAPSAGIELERSPEIPLEVESWVQEVEQHAHHAPKEVKVVDSFTAQMPAEEAKQSVVVLPVTRDVVKKGMSAKITESVHWLSAWCMRLIKKFHGMVAYREPSQG